MVEEVGASGGEEVVGWAEEDKTFFKTGAEFSDVLAKPVRFLVDSQEDGNGVGGEGADLLGAMEIEVVGSGVERGRRRGRGRASAS